MYPFLCRIFGHKLRSTMIYGAESLGLGQHACVRRGCTFTGYTFTINEVIGH